MSKHKKKNKKTIPYKSAGTVKYGADKYAVLMVLLYPVILYLINIKKLGTEFFLIYFILLPLFLPWLVFMVFCFRFSVKYDMNNRQIQYRNFFKFRTINFGEIRKIYKKSDGRTTFLIIKTDKKKIRINMRSCNGAREFYFALKIYMPKKISEY
ncbi:MAG: hypothetical protein NC177_08675 [Ruminococcus flavefaciens]|nr:hypothetical protein [Ruminococcus flavefaciens]